MTLRRDRLTAMEQLAYDMLLSKGYHAEKLYRHGMPDFMYEDGGSVTFYEVKGVNHPLRESQADVIHIFQKHGMETFVINGLGYWVPASAHEERVTRKTDGHSEPGPEPGIRLEAAWHYYVDKKIVRDGVSTTCRKRFLTIEEAREYRDS